jgi:hypothetical protein
LQKWAKNAYNRSTVAENCSKAHETAQKLRQMRAARQTSVFAGFLRESVEIA